MAKQWKPERVSASKAARRLRKVAASSPEDAGQIFADLAQAEDSVDVALVPVRVEKPSVTYPTVLGVTAREYSLDELVNELVFLRSMGSEPLMVYSVHASEAPFLAVAENEVLVARWARDLTRRFIYHELFYSVPEPALETILRRVLAGAHSVDIAVRGLEPGTTTRKTCRLRAS
jgi:hypothetical protein